MRKLLTATALIAATATAFAATNRPSGYTTICKIGETCSVSASTNVAFGAADLFVFKVLSGSFTCSVATFGSDPNPNKAVKECSVPSGGGGGGGPVPAPAPTPTPTPPPPPGGGGITGATCVSTGSTTINATIRITSGTFDGGCRTYNPGSGLGDGSQDEGQDPAFRVENGATLRNAILGDNGVDGVHFYNGGNLQNFRWLNVGEDAFTIKSSGTVTISGVTGVNGEDKFGQINAASTLNISNCIVDNAAKFIRQNGGTSFRITVNADRCQLSNLKEGVFRTDSSSSIARLTNSRLRNSGALCIGPWASCTGASNASF
jgi:pectate lyase C